MPAQPYIPQSPNVSGQQPLTSNFFPSALGPSALDSGGLGASLFGIKPAAANPVYTANQAIQGDLGNLAALYNLTTGTTAANAAGAAVPFQMNLPDYSALTTQASRNIGSELTGQVPQDVINLLQQQGAERGVMTGQGVGSPNSTAAYLRALGLTSLGLENQGQQDLTAAINRTPTGPAFNAASMYVTPAQQQAAQQAANVTAAAPDPTAAGLLHVLTNLF